MKKNVYQSELDRIGLSDAGKAFMVDGLMEKQLESRSDRSRCWRRHGLAAALAVALLVGTAAAAVVSLWDGYFGHLDEEQRGVVEHLSETLPAAVTCNSATITPLNAFGAGGVLYLMLEVEAPAGTRLPVLEEEGLYYLAGGAEPEVQARLELPDGQAVENFSYALDVTCLEDEEPDDNRICLVMKVTAQGDLAGLVLRIPGLWIWGTDGSFTPVFTGEFTFPLSENMGAENTVKLDVKSIATKTPWGPITLETLELSPLGVQWTYRIDETTAQAAAQEAAQMSENQAAVQSADGSDSPMEVELVPGVRMTLVMEDGREIEVNEEFSGKKKDLQICSGIFGAPVDLSQASHLLWGDAKIPVN